MPHLISERAKYRMARRGFRSARELAVAIGLPYGTVRNGVGGSDPLTMANIFRLARALREDNEVVEVVVADLVGNNEGVPDLPPEKKTKDTQGPKRRQERTTGPKRATGRSERVA